MASNINMLQLSRSSDVAYISTIAIDISNKGGKDYLTALPAEVLIKVIASLDLPDFFNLAHASGGIRSFMKIHAAPICNEAIRTRYSKLADKLDCKMQNGWLLPTHPRIFQAEERFMAKTGTKYKGRLRRWRGTYTQPTIKIAEPGPQFLLFLSGNTVIQARASEDQKLKLNPKWKIRTFKLVPLAQAATTFMDFVNGLREETVLEMEVFPGLQSFCLKGLTWYHGPLESFSVKHHGGK
jgi:hypothetical protein